ncbi:MAG: RNA 2',3'-cyclic phosphodiesterase [Alcanivorax sp.]|nr:RNA 2',3'-cyclic phosphodiesterase [Alcanivorax sp.]
MRCFVGIPVIGELVSHCLALNRGLHGAVPAANLHLTLAFLGSIDRSRRQVISDWLGRATQRHAPFTVTLQRCEPFPGARGPFLALSCESIPPQLLALQQDLLPGLAEADTHRPYRPHITLAKPGYGLPAKTGHWTLTVDRVCLYHSQVQPPGVPVYQPLAIYPLRPL